MIKKTFFIVFKLVGRIWSYLYSYKTSVKIGLVKNILYSAWVSREFKSVGKDVSFSTFVSLYGEKYISIGDRSSIGKNAILTAWDNYRKENFMPQIKIGNDVSIGEDSHITAINKIEIGNNVLIGKKITITDNSHGRTNFEALMFPPAYRPLYSEGPVIIEDCVWIGDKVTILPNVHIGKNVIVGANAVITKDIPQNSVVGGIPARIIKMIE
jgi:acetyltransferase-like isoleucine patch superfamily enzyme